MEKLLLDTLKQNPWITMNTLRNEHHISDVAVKKAVAEKKVVTSGAGKGTRYALADETPMVKPDNNKNQNLVLGAINSLRIATSTEIAKHVGIDPTLVRKATSELAELGKIKVQGKKKGTRYVSVTNPPEVVAELKEVDDDDEELEVQTSQPVLSFSDDD